MKKRILSTLFLAAAGTHASDALDADAQSRSDFVSKYAAPLVAGEARAVAAITAAMQVNGNRVIAYLCSDGGQRQTLALWSAQLLQAENYAPLAQHLATRAASAATQPPCVMPCKRPPTPTRTSWRYSNKRAKPPASATRTTRHLTKRVG